MTDVLRDLLGAWFPTHETVEGRLKPQHAPAFPAPRERRRPVRRQPPGVGRGLA